MRIEREGVQKPDELTQKCEEIDRREQETEDLVRDAVRDLFAIEREPSALMKQKEIYESSNRQQIAARTWRTCWKPLQ